MKLCVEGGSERPNEACNESPTDGGVSCPLRLMVRTSGFQPGNIGSTPVGDIDKRKIKSYNYCSS